MAKYPFLSDEWIAEARRIREEYRGKAGGSAQVIRMNQVVTEVPFGSGTINAHMDTSSGEMELETGHIDGADLTVTLDYATAKASWWTATPRPGCRPSWPGRSRSTAT